MEHEPEPIRCKYDFIRPGGYSVPASLRIEDTVEISMKYLTNALKFQHDTADIDSAATLFNQLVTTRFGTLQTTPAPANV